MEGAQAALLPPGIHWATLDEIEERFATNDVRRRLFNGFKNVVEALRQANCQRLYLDGSFVSAKEHPADFDGCWEPQYVIGALLDPVLLDFSNKRAAQKAKFGGEMFIATDTMQSGKTFLEFYQVDKDTGNPKGIVGIRLA